MTAAGKYVTRKKKTKDSFTDMNLTKLGLNWFGQCDLRLREYVSNFGHYNFKEKAITNWVCGV